MFFLVVLIAWFYSTLLHEVAHAAFAWKRGASVKIFPYWHKHQGRFYFARYEWKGGGEVTAMEHAAPVLHDVIIIIVSVILWAVLGSMLPLVFAVTSLIDTIVWMRGYFWGGPHTDGQKFKALMGTSP